jgi:hypothetical protein
VIPCHWLCGEILELYLGKFHPGTDHEGPEVECEYSSTFSLTSALDGGGWSTQRPGRFTPGKEPVTILQEAGLAPGPVWISEEILGPHQDSITGPSSP